MNNIFIIIIIVIIIFWIFNDLLKFFEYFNSGICITNKGVYGNYYNNECHSFSSNDKKTSSSNIPSANNSILVNSSGASVRSSGSASGGSSDGVLDSSGGDTVNKSIIELKNTLDSDCIKKSDLGIVCSARNNGSNNYGIKTIETSCCAIDKVKVSCELHTYNTKNYSDVINATPCLDKSISSDDACRIYQPNDNLRLIGYNINSIGSKNTLYAENGDCYNSDGKPDYNKARFLCNYDYIKNITKMTPFPDNYDYNKYTSCKLMNSDFKDDCKTILNKTSKNNVYAYVSGYDCIPGYGRAKCLDTSKKIEVSNNDKQFINNIHNKFE